MGILSFGFSGNTLNPAQHTKVRPLAWNYSRLASLSVRNSVWHSAISRAKNRRNAVRCAAVTCPGRIATFTCDWGVVTFCLFLCMWNNLQEMVAGNWDFLAWFDVIGDNELWWQIQIETTPDLYYPAILSNRLPFSSSFSHCLPFIL